MVVEVLPAQVVDVAGADQRAAHLAGDLDDALVRLLLVVEAVLLDLEVDAVVAEDAHQVVRVRPRLSLVVGQQPLAEARLQAAGEDDDAVGVALEEVQVHVRLAPLVALEEAGGAELDEVAEALVRLGQQRQVVALVAHRLGLDGRPPGRPRGRESA